MKMKKPLFWDKKKISFWAIIFLPFSLLYFFLSFFNKIKKKKYFKIPIICIGNIYLGGTGKTPLCIEIFQIIQKFGKNPGFVKKYYNYLEDEINLLKKVGPTFAATKRSDAINKLIENNNNVAILDDGFQDFSINKNFSIVIFNKNQWLGNGFLLPAGPLRENFSSISRADCIVINGTKDKNIEKKILKEKKLEIFYSNYIAKNIEKFKNEKIVAFAGIGNPNNFFNMLYDNNLNVIDKFSFPDHYKYRLKDLDFLKKKANELGAILLTTEKDYLRLDKNLKQNIEFLEVELKIQDEINFMKLIKLNL